MEDKPPTQAARDADRTRTPFGTPEQSTPQNKPTERNPRRGAKAAPPVTFQPPAGDAGTDASPAGTTPRPKPPPRKGAGQRPGRSGAARPAPPSTPPASAEPTPTSSSQPTSAEPTPTSSSQPTSAGQTPTPSSQPAKATPAKAAPGRRKAAKSATGAPAKVTNTGSTAATQQPTEESATGAATTADVPATSAADSTTTAAAAPAAGDAVQGTSAGESAQPTSPVKATPPRPESIPGAPTPSDPSVQEQLISDQTTPATPATLARPKGAPAKKAARKGGRPTPAKAQQQAKPPTTAASGTGTGETTATPVEATATAPPEVTATGTEEATAKVAVEATVIAAAQAAATSPAGTASSSTDGGDRTGAEPIPPADDQPTEKPTDTPPAEETRTGADPIPPADETPATAPEKSRSLVSRPAPEAPVAGKLTSTEPWAQLVADPGHAPELLALAAVQTIGPRAAEWAHRHREAYPTATDDALARLAVQQFTRFGSVASVFAAVAGSYAPITLLGSNALTYAEIVLHVAAAYGQDPTDRQRAVDLLVLAQVHPGREDAEAALATAEQPAYEDETRLTDAVWRLGRMVTAQAGAWAVLKGLNRFFPGTSMLAAIVTSRSGARNMGSKATAYYRAQQG